MVKVSVICPIFKAKNYIRPCVDSLLYRQGLDDLEVILVDDCSPDDTYEYAKECYKDNDRVRVFEQEKNSGPGEARNRGIREAKGEYIVFCDIDDLYKDGSIGEMAATADRTGADVYWPTVSYMSVIDPVPDDLSVLTEDQLLKIGYLTPEMAAREEIAEAGDMAERCEGFLKHHYHWNSISKLYRTSFLRAHNLFFPPISLAEDQYFILNCLIHADKYVFDQKCYYIIRVGNVASVSRTAAKNPRIFIKAMESIFESLDTMGGIFQDVPYFTEHPELIKKLIDFQVEQVENLFALPKYHELGREFLSENEDVKAIFKKYFGSLADFAEKTFFDAYDSRKASGELDFYTGKSAYEAMKEMKEKVGSGVYCLLEE